jgi:fatty-acyl-CoA synthase
VTTSQTLIDHLRRRAGQRPKAVYARYLFPDREPVEITFGETENRTRQFAALYARHGVTKGDVVLVVLEHHEDLMSAYLGAIWLGAIPSFLPALTAKLDPDRYHRNLGTLFETTQPRAILVYPELRDTLRSTLPVATRPVVLGMDEVSPRDVHGDPAPHEAEDLALIQYSSGSTGLQKGAALSHRAVLAEIRGVGAFFDLTSADSFLTWVPLYHDWGLVCVALHAIELGTSFTLLSPMHWVTRPVTAFEAVHRYRPTVYYHPNFAFNFMANRIKDREMTGLDLSSLRICCNGAEPCFYESHKMFADRFEAWGFRRESLSIVYGMAEVTNSVFAAGHEEPIKVDPIDRDVLQREHRAQPTSEDDPKAIRMLGVGRPLAGTEFTILDDDRRDVAERRVGEVAIRSDARYHGYHRNPEATARADHDGWYLSGDLGYRVGNTLFITGRKSDLIIVGGVNIYPHDVENIVAEHPDVVTGRVAAVGVDDAALGTQRLVVITESRSSDPAVLQLIADYARREVAMRLGVHVDRVYHAPYRWLIKTSSGKIARIPNYSRLEELEPPSGRA